jgi:hypothetical protein
MIKQKLEDAWNYFDQSVLLLSDKVYLGDSFILYKGKLQDIEPRMFQLLQKVNGKTELGSIFSAIYPRPTNSLEALKQKDAFSSLVAKAVTYEWLHFMPASVFEVQLR